MNSFKIIPLSEAYVKEIKNSKRDRFGNELVEELATGYGPCRLSLQPFKPGADIRILFNHNPFEIKNVYTQPGPVFIHKKESNLMKMFIASRRPLKRIKKIFR